MKASIYDTADHVLRQYRFRYRKPLERMKLQKLVYYCQGWSLAWDGRRLFPEKIRAWVHGPVVPELFELTDGLHDLEYLPGGLGDQERLTQAGRNTVHAVVREYGPLDPEDLTRLVCNEEPWQKARTRAGLGHMERGHSEILPADMKECYLAQDQQTGEES